MTKYRIYGLIIVAQLAVQGTALAGGDEVEQLPVAAQQVLVEHPGTQVYTLGTQVRAVYGAPMTAGADAGEAATLWLEAYGGAFGVDNLELQLLRVDDVSYGKFTVLAYGQTIGGLDVELGAARVLVLNGDLPRVVYVAASLARAPADGFAPLTINAKDAVAAVSSSRDYRHLPQWSNAELVIFFDPDGNETNEGVQAWKFSGAQPDLSRFEAYTFFVDAASGELIHVRDEVYNIDILGSVQGMGSPGTLPDMAGNPPVAMPVPDIRVSVSGGNNAFTDPLGDYTIPHAGATAVTVSTTVTGGRWSNISDVGGAEMSLSQSVVPPGPGDFLFNASPSPFTTAQVNAFVNTTLTHNYITDRAPAYTGINRALLTNVNLAQTCNAYFTTNPLSINFYRAGGGCNNTAYSTVVAHEYGHFIVWALNLSQGAFGEGYGDTIGMLLYDTPIVGEYFFTGGGAIRQPGISVRTYPCSGEIHFCGELVAGVWWRIRQNLGATFGSATGLAMAQQLQVDWTLITLGGQGTNSAHPQTAIEVLTVDDDDGNLGNGTPNYSDICAAFDTHGIDCPPIIWIRFEYPNGRPDMLTPNQATTVRVNVVADVANPVPGSGTVTTRVDGGAPLTVPMNEITPNQYAATLPAVDCLSAVDYYFTADADNGETVSDPHGAPGTTFSVVAASSAVTAVDLNFEQNTGWTVVNQNLTTGAWVRVVPTGGGGRGDPPGDFDGSGRAWVTGNGPQEDVDGGPTILTSIDYDLSAFDDAAVSYARWFTNDDQDDFLLIDVSDDGGLGWTRVETVPNTAGWVVREFFVSDFVGLTAQFRIRFSTADNPNNSVTEAAIDRFRIEGFNCGAGCPADLNGDGVIDLADLGILLADFGCPQPGPCAGDVDGDGDTDLADLGILLSVFGQPCP